MTQDELDVRQALDRAPIDPERLAFYAAMLGILRTIRLIVLVCLALELYGRIIQTLVVFFPQSGVHV